MVIDWRSGETVEQVGSGTALGRLAGEPGENVTARAKTGDEKAIALLRQVGKGLAVGVHDVVHCFMPERVVMGGGLLQAGDLVLASIREELARCTKGCSVKGEDVVLAQGADDVGLLGGFAYWEELHAGEHRRAPPREHHGEAAITQPRAAGEVRHPPRPGRPRNLSSDGGLLARV